MAQYQFVVQVIQSGSLSGLEIDTGFAAQRRMDIAGLLQPGVKIRTGLAQRRNRALQFRFAFADVGVHIGSVCQVECDRAIHSTYSEDIVVARYRRTGRKSRS